MPPMKRSNKTAKTSTAISATKKSPAESRKARTTKGALMDQSPPEEKPGQPAQPEQPAKPKVDFGFSSKLVDDPAKPPALTMISGIRGESTEAEHTRIYLTPDLSSHVEIPNDAIKHSQKISDDPFDTEYLWIARDAKVISQQTQGEAMFPTQTIPQTIPPACPGVTPAGTGPTVQLTPPIILSHPPNCPTVFPLCHPSLPPLCHPTYPPICPPPTFPPHCHPSLPPICHPTLPIICFHTQTAVCPPTIHPTTIQPTPPEAAAGAAAQPGAAPQAIQPTP